MYPAFQFECKVAESLMSLTTEHYNLCLCLLFVLCVYSDDFVETECIWLPTKLEVKFYTFIHLIENGCDQLQTLDVSHLGKSLQDPLEEHRKGCC